MSATASATQTLLNFSAAATPSKEASTKKPTPVEKNLITDRPQELVIMVGGPGSGKSTLAVHHMQGYVRVNNDELKTKEKCMKVCGE